MFTRGVVSFFHRLGASRHQAEDNGTGFGLHCARQKEGNVALGWAGICLWRNAEVSPSSSNRDYHPSVTTCSEDTSQPLPPLSPTSPSSNHSYLLFREESIHIDSNQKWVKIFVTAANGTLTIASDNEDGPGAEYSLGSCALHQLSKDQEGETRVEKRSKCAPSLLPPLSSLTNRPQSTPQFPHRSQVRAQFHVRCGVCHEKNKADLCSREPGRA